MRGWNWAVVGLWAVGCASAAPSAVAGADAGPDGVTAADTVAVADTGAETASAAEVTLGAPPANLVVHHWATFTVFHAAVAKQHVPGVGRDEEELPAFVHSRGFGPAGATTEWATPPLAKIQTAGAFFSADAPGDVRVDVTVPQGQVSADWPPATQPGPAAGPVALADGKASWMLHIDPKLTMPIPAEATDSLWQALRATTGANVSNVDGKTATDRQLFYRALGNFAPPLRISAKKDTNFPGYTGTVSNDGDTTVPRAWLLYLHAGGGLMQALYSVPGKGTTPFSPTPKEAPADYYAKVKSTLQFELKDAGLTEQEAAALTATFTHNWLKTFGLRVIVVAPQAWSDAYVQTKVTPTPSAEVHVMLGRFELLTADDEQLMLNKLKVAAIKADQTILGQLGFFAEPKLRRAIQAGDAGVQGFATELLKAAEKVK